MRALATLLPLVASLCWAARTRVLVVGAGPGGLLAAHCLLGRGDRFEVCIVDARERPEREGDGARAYSLGLNIRGQTALRHFDRAGGSEGLFAEVAAEAVSSDSFFLHLGGRAIQIRKPRPEEETGVPPTLLLPRSRLCAALLRSLERSYGGRGTLDVRYECPLERLDIDGRTAFLGGAKEFRYDFVIGADGVQSRVRRSLFSDPSSAYRCAEATLPGFFKVMTQRSVNSSLDPSAVHLLASGADFGLFVLPAPANATATLVSWKGDAPPCLRPDAPESETRAAIEKAYPMFGSVSSEAVRQLGRQRPSFAQTVRCNACADPRGVLLLGDAAHCTGGTLGQGANSALMDVRALDLLLAEEGDDLGLALPRYSASQTREGLALWSLLQLPPKGPLGPLYQAMQFARPLLRRVLGRWPEATQTALSQTLRPFSSIVEQNAFWVRAATSGQEPMDPLL